MRLLATLLALSLIFGAPATFAQDANDPAFLAPAIEQCIRANAPKVETAVNDLSQGTTFLSEYVCALPIAQENARLSKAAMQKQADRMKTMCAQMATRQNSAAKSDTSDDGSAWQSVCGDNSLIDYTDQDTYYLVPNLPGQGNAPPAAKALAAQLLLDLRLSHSKAGSTH